MSDTALVQSGQQPHRDPSIEMRRPKVIFLASWYPNEDHPINGIFIQRHARAVSAWCDVGVVYIHQSLHRTWKEREVVVTDEDGIKVVRIYLSRSPFGKIPLNLAYYRTLNSPNIAALRGVRRLVRELGGVDILHLNVVPRLGLAGVFAARQYRVPLITTEHSSIYHDKPPSGLQRHLYRLILERSAVVLPVSRALERDLKTIAPKAHYEIVPNIVDTSVFVPASDSKAAHVKRVVHVSLLRESEKNISGLLCAIKRLRELRDDFELHIIGDGPDKKHLEDRVKSLDLSGVVVFHGIVSEEGVRDLLRQSHVFVLNSEYETFSIVGIEALASGVPVISTRCGGPEDYINESNGVLIDVGDEDQLVDALNRMLDTWQDYDGDSLHDAMAESYSPEIIGKMLTSIYKRFIFQQA